MGEKTIAGIVAILTAIIGVAILAVLVSRNSQTTGVIQAASQGFTSILSTAVSPATTGGGLSSGLLSGFSNLGNMGANSIPLTYPFLG